MQKGGVERRKRRTVKRSIEREFREGVSKGGQSQGGDGLVTCEEKGGVERRQRRTVKRSIERECSGVQKGVRDKLNFDPASNSTITNYSIQKLKKKKVLRPFSGLQIPFSYLCLSFTKLNKKMKRHFLLLYMFGENVPCVLVRTPGTRSCVPLFPLSSLN